MKNLNDKRPIYIELPKYPRDKIAINVSKGKRDFYRQAAKELSLSLSVLIQRGVEEFILNHSDKETLAKLKAEEKLSKDRRKLAEAFDALPKDSQRIILKLVKDFAAKVSDTQSPS